MAKVHRETLDGRFRGELLSWRTALLSMRGDLERMRRALEAQCRRITRERPDFCALHVLGPELIEGCFADLETMFDEQLKEIERYTKR